MIALNSSHRTVSSPTPRTSTRRAKPRVKPTPSWAGIDATSMRSLPRSRSTVMRLEPTSRSLSDLVPKTPSSRRRSNLKPMSSILFRSRLPRCRSPPLKPQAQLRLGAQPSPFFKVAHSLRSPNVWPSPKAPPWTSTRSVSSAAMPAAPTA